MNKINILLCFVALITMASCATYSPQYASDKIVNDKDTPLNEIDKTFYLIGNVGSDEASSSLKGLSQYIAQHNSKDSYVLFMGNSFYPKGIDIKDEFLTAKAENSMQMQLDALKHFKGKIIVIPGAMEWEFGVEGLQREEEFLKEKFNGDHILQPHNGCPLESIDISKNVQLILFDSQWFMEDWDEHPKMNKKCDIKTREKLFKEIESELKKQREKTIIFAMYHPMITNGQHGGKYPFIHQDVFSTLIKQVKTQGAISKDDRYNQLYNSLMERLQILSRNHKRMVFVSSLDKSLQYSEQANVKQVVSGSGSGATAASLGQYGLFSYGGQGFGRLDVFKDAKVQLQFVKIGEDSKLEIIFEKEIIPSEEKFDISSLNDNFSNTIKAKVYEDNDQVDKTGFYKTVWGKHYRDVYGTEIKAETVLLDTLYGGLEVVRAGGGHQTRTLRLQDKDGKPYNMRALKKSAVQFLQTVIVKDKQVEEDFKNTIPEDLILDFYTAAHPYGALTIPKLAEAANIFYTNPKLYYVPKQKALGKFNADYGDELYMIEEKPDKKFEKDFYGAVDNVESTDDLFEKLQRNGKYKLDEKEYIRARIFDMLIGDWDRHDSQWRFAQYDHDDGTSTFKPIPRDRDQVYSNFDGGIFDVVRSLFNTSRQFQVYGPELKHTEWFNAAGIKMDRALIQNYGKEAWIAEAEFIQKQVTEEIIDAAFRDLPEEVQDKTSLEIKENLKGRNKNIVKIAEEYFDYLAKLQTVTGTNKEDYFDITRLPDGKTNIKVFRIKDGEKENLLVDRTFDKKETKEIWVYGLDDKDVFEVSGNGNNPIFIRLIGGQNKDTYIFKNGKNIKVYDQKSEKSTMEEKGGAAFRFTNNYDLNTYDFLKQKRIINLLLPAIGYNPDDGFKIGISDVMTVYGFQRNPFAQQHRFFAGFYFGTHSFDLNYEGEFANIFGSWNLLLGANFQNPNYSQNYYGFGNESINPDYEYGYEERYNRVRIGGYGTSIGIKKESAYGSILQFDAVFESNKVEGTEDRFIVLDEPTELDQSKYFLSAQGQYSYESYDNKVNPTRGMNFKILTGVTQNLQDKDRIFGYIKPEIVFYNALTKNRKLILKTDVSAQLNVGNNFEFYQAAKLGNTTGLRAYQDERFIGKYAALASGDLRYSFNKFRTGLIPVQIGVFGGYDIGRVWISNDTSKMWHSSYGGGLWINSADLVSGTVSVFAGEENIYLSFGLLLSM